MTTCSILEAREGRWLRKIALAGSSGGSVLSLALNVPGPDKNPPGSAQAFKVLHTAMRAALSAFGAQGALLAEELVEASADGPYALWALSVEPEALKRVALELEENHPLGRLADFDVLSAEGTPLSRADLGLPPRRCFLCGEEAALCRRKGSHPLEETVNFTRGLLAMAGRQKQGN